MALSPWTGNCRLETREAAALLAGVSPTKAGPELEGQNNEYNLWRARILSAWLFEGLPIDWPRPIDEQGRPIERFIDVIGPNNIWAWLEKPDLHKWLLNQNIPDGDIPVEIRTYKKEESLNYASQGEELRALEAFGLLVELYAHQHGPDYRHGARPKASRIVKDMLDAMPDDVTGMGDRKLKEHMGAAIKAWEAKKRS